MARIDMEFEVRQSVLSSVVVTGHVVYCVCRVSLLARLRQQKHSLQ